MVWNLQRIELEVNIKIIKNDFNLHIPLYVEKIIEDDLSTVEEATKDLKNAWKGKVFVVEKLGSGTFLYLDKEGEPLVVETDGDSKIKVGDTINVAFNPDKCHVFNASKEVI